MSIVKLFSLAAVTLLAACGHAGHMMYSGPGARAAMEPTKGNTAAGMVGFHATEAGVMVHVSLSGLKANAEHGFHVHEKGDCSSGDGLSTGGHFNPAGKPHGPQDGDHHAGDLPSLKADAAGKVDVHLQVNGISLAAGPTSIVGRGLIVHAMPDDYKTQPTGNAGGRIACGVIAAVP